jgi:hypothetical protein
MHATSEPIGASHRCLVILSLFLKGQYNQAPIGLFKLQANCIKIQTVPIDFSGIAKRDIWSIRTGKAVVP